MLSAFSDLVHLQSPCWDVCSFCMLLRQIFNFDLETRNLKCKIYSAWFMCVHGYTRRSTLLLFELWKYRENFEGLVLNEVWEGTGLHSTFWFKEAPCPRKQLLRSKRFSFQKQLSSIALTKTGTLFQESISFAIHTCLLCTSPLIDQKGIEAKRKAYVQYSRQASFTKSPPTQTSNCFSFTPRSVESGVCRPIERGERGFFGAGLARFQLKNVA